MNENPYATPSAPVADVPSFHADARDLPWFAVSVSKFLVMSVCTMTAYHVYWFYKHWSLVKRREQANILPAARALFAVFSCYQLFKRIRDYDDQARIKERFAAGALATGWIITSLLRRLPDPYWWISMSGVIFVLPVQARVNALNAAADPRHDPNGNYSAWNWVAIVLGGLLLLFALAGTFHPL